MSGYQNRSTTSMTKERAHPPSTIHHKRLNLLETKEDPQAEARLLGVCAVWGSPPRGRHRDTTMPSSSQEPSCHGKKPVEFTVGPATRSPIIPSQLV